MATPLIKNKNKKDKKIKCKHIVLQPLESDAIAPESNDSTQSCRLPIEKPLRIYNNYKEACNINLNSICIT